MEKKHILIISHGFFDANSLEELAGEVAREYHHPVIFEESHTDLSMFYDPSRRQYDGNKILKLLDSLHNPAHLRTMGLFRVDLYIPILTYIFGQAFLNGNTGIASLYRLKNEQYGLEKDDDLLLERFMKVVIHELGHTFGLTHCHNPGCVMRAATYIEDIDQKSNTLCLPCRNAIGSLI